MARCIAIVGMNGAGKTNFGKRLASKLGMLFSDTDALFEKTHGNTHKFIEEHGWDAYRKEEETIVLGALEADHVVILSGGAVESPTVRARLKERAVVLWIQAHAKRIHEHLKRAKVARPEFADGIHREKVDSMLETRNPLYKEVANILLFPSTPFARQIPVALTELKKFLK